MVVMGRIRFVVLLTALTVIGAGCGKKPQIRALDKSSVVLAFGDSLTYGNGVAAENSYPSDLAKMLGCQVINKGEPGEMTSGGRRRLPRVLKQIKPDLVILCHGGNDMLRKYDRAETINNLDKMIVMIRNAGADIILVGVPEPNLILKSPPFYKDLARKYELPFDTKTLSEISSDRSLKSDRIHPNEEGYKIMAEAIFALISKSENKSN